MQKLWSQTSFSPHFQNKTTSVAENETYTSQPHYLILTGKNEVMRSGEQIANHCY